MRAKPEAIGASISSKFGEWLTQSQVGSVNNKGHRFTGFTQSSINKVFLAPFSICGLTLLVFWIGINY